MAGRQETVGYVDAVDNLIARRIERDRFDEFIRRLLMKAMQRGREVEREMKKEGEKPKLNVEVIDLMETKHSMVL